MCNNCDDWKDVLKSDEDEENNDVFLKDIFDRDDFGDTGDSGLDYGSRRTEVRSKDAWSDSQDVGMFETQEQEAL